jgi:hypothetical protein
MPGLASLGGALLSVGKICLRERRQLEVIQITGPSRRVQHAPSGAAVPLYVFGKKRSAEHEHLYPVLDLLHGNLPPRKFQ